MKLYPHCCAGKARRFSALFLFLTGMVIAIGAKAQAPVLSSLSTLSGQPGSSVTITGSNFNTTAANNIVHFGATRGVVTAASATELTVTVPVSATYSPIMVANTGTGLTGWSSNSFLPVFDNSDFIPGAVSFDDKAGISASTDYLTDLAIGDLDNDGKPDVAAIHFNAGISTLAVYRNTSTAGTIDVGSFAPAHTFPTPSGTTTVKIDDIDGDGKKDIILFGDGTEILRNTTTTGSINSESFAPPVHIAAVGTASGSSFALCDFDKDGKPDIARYDGGYIYLSHNEGTAGIITEETYAGSMSYPLSSLGEPMPLYYALERIAAADVDGDGKQDIVITHSNGLSIFRNVSVPGMFTEDSFEPSVVFAMETPGNSFRSIVVADFDGDGKPDVAAGRTGGVSIYRNIAGPGSFGSMSFDTPVAVFIGTGDTYGMAVGDMDGNGKPEIIINQVATVTYNITTTVIQNNCTPGTIIFDRHSDFLTHWTDTKVSVCDMDGDTRPDIIVGNVWGAGYGASPVSVFRNNPPLPPVAVTSLSQEIAIPGTSITISGVNFNPVAANNSVYFGATRASVTSASATSITADVPQGAAYAPVSVTNIASALTANAPVPFLPTYDNTAYIPGLPGFSAPLELQAPYSPLAVALGDIDGDGRPDLVSVGGAGIAVYRNISPTGGISNTSFAGKIEIEVPLGPHTPRQVIIRDMDGDGKPDVVVGSHGPAIVLRNIAEPGTIGPASFVPSAVAGWGWPLAVGDIDGDGRPDIVTRYSMGIGINRNASRPGHMSFGATANNAGAYFPLINEPYYSINDFSDLEIVDIDGDGRQDIALSYGNGSGERIISLLRNTASPGSITEGVALAEKVDIASPTIVVKMSFYDIDGDGLKDLITMDGETGTMAIRHNEGLPGTITTGSFAAAVSFAADNGKGMTCGDFDGDGKPDIALTRISYPANKLTASLFLNTATPGIIDESSLADRKDFPLNTNIDYSSYIIPGYVPPIAAGDLNADNKADLVVASSYGMTNMIGSEVISILQNTPFLPPPTITSVTPNTSHPGTSVTITGTNFNTTADSNIVYFGATKAAVTAASETELTAIVPLGATYMPVSVNNTAVGLAGAAPTAFLHSFDNSGYIPGAVNFEPHVDFSVPTDVRVINADYDGDGRADLITYDNTGTITIYRNTSVAGSISSTSFAAGVVCPDVTAPWSYQLEVYDLDNDGKKDIVTINGAMIIVIKNTSVPGTINESSFAAAVNLPVESAIDFTIADIDGDGRGDIVSLGSYNITVLRNLSAPGMLTAASFAPVVGHGYGTDQFIASGDIDGDGKPDIVTGNSVPGILSVYRNTASIGNITETWLETPATFEGVMYMQKPVIADLNNDGKNDLAIGGDYGTAVLQNVGTPGAITSSTLLPRVDLSSVPANALAIGDFDGDGRPDIGAALMTSYGAGRAGVIRNNGEAGGTITPASFAPIAEFTVRDAVPGEYTYTPTYMNSIAAGDLDNDGKADLAGSVSYGSAYHIAILRNAPLLPPPTVTAVSPNVAQPGTSVTITGTNFNTSAENNSVYFGTTKATVTAASATELTAVVPLGATYMPVSVNNTALGLEGRAPTGFLQTFDNSGHIPGAIAFEPHMDINSSANSHFVLADIDADGKTDVASINITGLTIYRNISESGSINEGSFAAGVTFASGYGAGQVCLMADDLDGDGKKDIAILSYDKLEILHNTATPGTIDAGSLAPRIAFAMPVTYGTSASGNWATTADIDGDGRTDIVTTNYTYSSGSFSVFRNLCSPGSITAGSFAIAADISLPEQAYHVTAGDLDGDSKPDLVFTTLTGGGSSSAIKAIRNLSTPGNINAASFEAPLTLLEGGGYNSRKSLIADLDQDGAQDIAVPNSDGTISILRNTNAGPGLSASSFAGKVDFTACTLPLPHSSTYVDPQTIAVGDLDGDGRPELAVAYATGTGGGLQNSIGVLKNNTTPGSIAEGAFALAAELSTGAESADYTYPSAIAICDMDGDNRPDIVGGIPTPASQSHISVLRNVGLLPPPTVTSVSPNVALPGTSVTITGTNFNTTAGNNIVRFGATQAVVTAASETELTAVVPLGATHMPVSVNNTALGLAGYSTMHFLHNFDNSPYLPGTVNFAPPVEFDSVNSSENTVIDIDGDGKPDIVALSYDGVSALVYRNISAPGTLTNSSFAAPVAIAGGGTTCADLDGDGRPDMISQDYSTGDIKVLRNLATPGEINTVSFAAPVIVANTSAYPYISIRSVCDVDGDGRLDIIGSKSSSGWDDALVIYRNTITGPGLISASSFSSRTEIPMAANYSAMGDMDGDGRPDLVTTNYMANTVEVRRNMSTPGYISAASFEPPVTFITGSTPYSPALADLDGDGKLDIAVPNWSDNFVSVFRNNSSGPGSITYSSFEPRADIPLGIPLGAGSDAIAIADFDGDGRPDMAVNSTQSYAAPKVTVLRNISSPGAISPTSFAPYVEFRASAAIPEGYNYKPSACDLDGDGKADIVTGAWPSSEPYVGRLSILRNNPLLPPPTVTSVNPNIDRPGNSVTITGTNFNPATGNNIVYFGATKAVVTSASETELTAIVPLGATYMPVSVNNTALNLAGHAPRAFLPTFDNSPYVKDTVNFDPMIAFATSGNPNNVVLADIDGDGRTDMVSAGYSTNSLSVHRNTSVAGSITPGSFAASTIAISDAIYDNFRVFAEDLDGDGRKDVILMGNSLVLLRNISAPGTILFETPKKITLSVPYGLTNNSAIADFDADGRPDIVTTASYNDVYVLRNISAPGTISLSSPFAFTIPGFEQLGAVTAADLNSDGKADIAVAGPASNSIWVFTNNSAVGSLNTSSFMAPQQIPTPYPGSLTATDVDGDGHTDLWSSNWVLRNNGTPGEVMAGTFNPAETFTDMSGGPVAIGDFNGDNRPDITTTGMWSSSIAVLRNTATTGDAAPVSFSGPKTLAYPGYPSEFSVGDMDGDGLPDIVAPNYGEGKLYVYRNHPLLVEQGLVIMCTGTTDTLSDTLAAGSWTTSNAGVAMVNSDGIVTATGAGVATVTYTGPGGVIATTVSVNVPLTPGAVQIAGGNTLYAGSGTVLILNTAVTGGTWSSSVPSVAAVDSNGVVSPASAGATVISYTVGNSCGSVTATHPVTVGPEGSVTCNMWEKLGSGVAVAAFEIDSDGQPYTASTDGWPGYKATVKRYSGTAWVTVGNPSFSAGEAGFISMAIDGSDIPYVIYRDGANGNKATVMKLTGSIWSEVGTAGFSAGAMDRNSIAIDGTGVPWVAYNDASMSYRTVVKKYVDGAWLTVGSPGSAYSSDPVIKIDNEGTAYLLRDTLKRFNGTAWVNVGPGNFAPGYSYNRSMTLSASGIPYVIYTDAAYKLTVKKYEAGSWSTVGTAGFAQPPGTYMPSIAIDGAGMPWMAYLDNANNSKITVRKYESSEWKVVGKAGFSNGGYPQLKIRPDNSPVIGYSSGVAELKTGPITPVTGTMSVCTGATINLDNKTLGGTWSSSNTAVAMPQSDASVYGFMAGTSVISYIVNNECGTALATATVTVNGGSAVLSGPAETCIGTSIVLTTSESTGYWSSDQPWIATVDETGTVTGVSAGTVFISYYTYGTCGGFTTTKVVTVNEAVSAGTITGTATLCAESSTALYNEAPGGTWSSGNGEVATIDEYGNVTGLSPGTSVISYTVASPACGNIAATLEVTVNALPDAGAITGTATLCDGGATTLYNEAMGGYWSSEDPSVAVIGEYGMVNGISAGTALISYTITAECGVAATTQVVTVNAVANAGTISGIATTCVDNTTTLSADVDGGTWTSENSSVATIDEEGLLTGISAGTALISYTLTTACGTDVATREVTVNALPNAGSISGAATLCAESNTTLSSDVAGGAWSSEHMSVATVNSTGVVTGISAGTALISYTAATECGTAATTQVVTVNALPDAGAITGAATVCAGSNTALGNEAAGGAWSSAHTSIATVNSMGVVTGINTGTTLISYIVSTACGSDVATHEVTVNALPNAGSISGAATLCAESNTTLSSDIAGGVWSSENLSVVTVSSIGVVSGISAGTALISYTASTECGTDAATKVVTVNALPDPGTITGTATVCAGSNTTLGNETAGGTWSSVHTSIATVNSTGVVTGISAGTALISYTAGTECGTAAATQVVTVNALPNAGTITGTATVCAGSTTALANEAMGGIWSSAHTSIATVSSTGVVTGISAGTALISYTAASECGTDAATKVVTVNALPDPGTITGTATVCAGSSNTTLANIANGGTWSSAHTSIAAVNSTGVVTGISAGTALISYTAGTVCGTAAATQIVTVNALPDAITGTLAACAGTTTTLSATPAGGTWTATSGSGTATIGSTNGILTAGTTGTANITYSLASGCYRTAIATINTLPAAISGPGSVCAGSAIDLASATVGGTWTSSNTPVATVPSAPGTVTGIAAGTSAITYKLTATGCYASRTITVNAAPSAITGPLLLPAAGSATLSSSPAGGTWASGAPAIATVGSSTGAVQATGIGTAGITYTLPAGCYVTAQVTVSLADISGPASMCAGTAATFSHTMADGTWSSSNTARATVNSSTGAVTGVSAGAVNITYHLGGGVYQVKPVTVLTTPAISGTAGICIGSGTTLNGSPADGTWSGTGGGILSINASTGEITGISNGTATVTYTIGGCYATRVATVNSALPAIEGEAVVCIGSTITMTNLSGGGTWSSSAPGNASIAAASGIVTGISAGSAVMSYVTGTGCYATATLSVTPMPGPISGPTVVCASNTITLSHATPGGTWSSSNTLGATVSTGGVVTGGGAGTVTLSYHTSTGCYSTHVITVNASPAAIGGPSAVCEGMSATLTNTGSGTWSSSNDDVATIPAAPGTVAGISAGTAIITFRLTSTGCIATRTITVTALPDPISGSNSICAGTTEVYTSAPAGGTWYTTTSIVATVGSTGAVTGNNAGVALVTYTSAAGCRRTKDVTVSALPAVISGNLTVCVGSTTTLTSTTATQTWSSDNAAIATVAASSTTTGLVTGVDVGNTTISYTNSYGCARTTTLAVIAAPADITGSSQVCLGGTIALSNPTGGGAWTSNSTNAPVSGSGIVSGSAIGNATITYRTGPTCFVTKTVSVTGAPADPITGPTGVCIGSTITLSHAVAGGTWSSSAAGKGSISAAGVVTGVAAGSATITYYTGESCYRTYQITVNALPGAIGGTAVVCEGATVTLTPPTAGGSWVNNGAFATIGSSSGIVSGYAAGNTTVSYVLTATGCYSTKAVIVNATPDPISGTNPICVGTSAPFTTTPSGGTWASVTGGVASVGMSTGMVNGLNAGTSIISYTLPTGCKRQRVVTVNAIPGTITGTTSMCVGGTSSLVASNGNLAWSSSDVGIATVGSTSAIAGLVTGVGVGSALISYTNAAGCARVVTVNITAGPAPITGDDVVCIGGTVTLGNTGAGTWATSAATVTIGVNTGVVTGASVGTTTITFRSGPTCFTTKTMTVTAQPAAAITGPASVCVGAQITLVHPVTTGTWASGNTGRATVNAGTGVVTGVTAGTVVITYYTSGGCYRTYSITVHPPSMPVSGTLSVCEGATTSLSSATGGGTWSTTDATVATVNPTSGLVSGIAAGTAFVVYTVGGSGCAASAMLMVNPLPALITPVAGGPICVNASDTWTSTPAGGTWTSGAGIYATVGAATGVVTGVAGGTANITYTISTGCYRTRTASINPQPATISGPTSVNELSSITLTNATAGGTWSTSDASIATIVTGTGVLTGAATGTVVVTYRLTSTGCFRTRVTTVNPFGSRQSGAGGNADISITEARIYPSPTSGVITIEAPVTGIFTLYTIDGRKIEVFDVAAPVTHFSFPRHLAAGAYMCKFEGVDGSVKVAHVVYAP